MQNRVKLLFEELSYKSEFELLDYGKHKDELEEVGKKRGIKLPSKDIAIFKCKYAMIDQENRNGCILPKKEVEKALDTLVSKAIDKDHFRKSTIGYWLDVKSIKNDIIAYGCFWKSNFPEDYEDIKNRMKDGKMKISFEAWGTREFNKDGSYNLTDIEFAGGALLFDTEPAFPDAEVLNFSSLNEKILEFAKVVEEAKEEQITKEEIKEEKVIEKSIEEKKTVQVEESKEPIVEQARLDFNYDKETIARMMFETTCPSCGAKGWNDIQNINFVTNKIKSRCPGCDGIAEYDLTPSVSIVKSGEKPTEMKVAEVKEEKKQEIDLQNSKKEGGIAVDEFLKKYSKASAEELVSFLDKELDTIKQTLTSKDGEIATLKTEKDSMTKVIEEHKLMVENSKLEIEKVKVEHATIKAELDKRVADEKAVVVKSRKDSLGEFSKDMSDEDILNDLKFENAKLKKELAEVIKKKPDEGLDAGKLIETNIDKAYEKQKSVHERTWAEK
jgi:hypothetical protein